MQQLFKKKNLELIKKSFIAGSLISIAVYAWVRILFYEFGFTITEEVMIGVKVILSGGLMATGMVLVLLLIELTIGQFQLLASGSVKNANETGTIVVMENGMLLNLDEEVISPDTKTIIHEQAETINVC